MNILNPRNVIGGALGWYEDEGGFERESFLSSVTKVADGVIDAFKEEPEYNLDPAKFPSKGSIEFNKKEQSAQEKLKQKEEADRKKAYWATLEQDRQRAQQAKDKLLFEEEINDITANLSTDEKNKLLHYQTSYKHNRNVYSLAELRKKIIEERRKAEKQKTEASIAETKPERASAMNAAFEGGSGTQGSGTANLSAHATG